MTRIAHVNLPVPVGRTDEVAGFYVTVLGFTIDPDRGERGRAGAWLDVGDGSQVHLSERHGAAHPDQHVAFDVDDFEGIHARAVAAGAEWTARGEGRAVTRDPAGNLVELFA